MPSKQNARVKTNGLGEIEFVNSPEASDPSATTSASSRSTDNTETHQHLLSTTAINLGIGEGLFAGSNGSERIVLEFKSIAAGNGIRIDDDGNTLTIHATGAGGGNGGGNGGGGQPVEFGDGFDIPLGDILTKGDGSWTPGAVPLTDETTVSDAVDSINEILGRLVPTQPPAFPNGPLTITNTAGNSPRLVAGYADSSNGGHTLVAGATVTRISAAGAISNVFNDVGSGDSGVISLSVNGAVVASRELTGSDVGNHGGIVIADQKDFPENLPGFWKSVDISANPAPATVGLNKIKLAHTGGGQTSEVFFVRDSLNAAPAVTAVGVVQSALGVVRHSSGIPHYSNGARLRVTATMNNFAGETYYGGADPFTVGTGGGAFMASQDFGYGAIGIATPLARNSTAPVALLPVEAEVNGTNFHGFGWVNAVGRNVVGASTAATDTVTTTAVSPTTSYAPFNVPQTKVLVMRGTATGKIDENSVAVTGLGSMPNGNNATRMSLAAATDRPAAAVAAWDSTAALAAHDAAVVAGVLMHDQTDFSKSFLPTGPNYSSGRSGAQYVVFEFARSAVSTFKINVTGTYAGCYVRLLGVTDNSAISPNATGGWLDASKAYDGAGVPGEAGDTLAGCAQGALMAGGSGAYTITFGPQTSSNATGNKIQVRFKLNAGQYITALSFSN